MRQKFEEKNLMVIGRDQDDSMNLFTHKCFIQERAGSIEEAWNMNYINYATIPKHVKRILGIITPMFSIGGPFTYSPFHVEDEDLLLASYPCSRHQIYDTSFHHHSVAGLDLSLLQM